MKTHVRSSVPLPTRHRTGFRLRRGRLDDLPALAELEGHAFTPERREHPGTLRRALSSPHQEVWLAWAGDTLAGALLLRIYLHSVRVYSIAVAPDFQGQGLGRTLFGYAEKRARLRRAERLTLEMDARDDRLRRWYEAQGFVQHRLWQDYYAPGWDACRYVKNLLL